MNNCLGYRAFNIRAYRIQDTSSDFFQFCCFSWRGIAFGRKNPPKTTAPRRHDPPERWANQSLRRPLVRWASWAAPPRSATTFLRSPPPPRRPSTSRKGVRRAMPARRASPEWSSQTKNRGLMRVRTSGAPRPRAAGAGPERLSGTGGRRMAIENRKLRATRSIQDSRELGCWEHFEGAARAERIAGCRSH